MPTHDRSDRERIDACLTYAVGRADGRVGNPHPFHVHRCSAPCSSARIFEPGAAAAGAFAALAAAMFHARVRVRVSSWQEEVG